MGENADQNNSEYGHFLRSAKLAPAIQTKQEIKPKNRWNTAHRGVFRTQSNIYDEAFLRKYLKLLGVKNFCKKATW